MILKTKRFLTSVNAANCYLCWCPETLEGAIVDPAEFTAEMRQVIEEHGIALRAVLLTHGHFDHDGAAAEVASEFGAKIMAAGSYPGGERLEGGEIVTLGNATLRVEATPGHTEDSISFIGEGMAFVGDALFAAAVGGTTDRAHFERETEGIRGSLFGLSGDTLLYPGHGPATTVDVERTYNPFFI